MVRVYREHVPERQAPGCRLGRHVHHDPRSRAYPALLAADVVSVRHERHTPITEQGNLGSCTGQALVGALGCTPLWEPLAVLAPGLALDASLAVDVYSDATVLDDGEGIAGHWPPTDTGSSGLAVCKAASLRGWITGYRWAFGADEVLRAAVLGPVLLGVGWYDSFDEPADSGELLITAGAVVRGGHEVVLTEVDATRRRVWVDNSWGAEWGVDGRAWMSWTVLGRLLAERGDAVVPVPVDCDPPQPVHVTRLEQAVQWILGHSRPLVRC